MGKKSINHIVHRPKTESEFRNLHRRLSERRYVAIDMLRPGRVKDVSLAVGDAATAGAQDMATSMGCGTWSNGPLSKVAWAFDGRTDTVEHVKDKDGNVLGDYVKWGAADNIPSVIPPLAMSSPYTSAPLMYIADLTTGLGVRYMYRLPNGDVCEFKDAGEKLQQEVDRLEQAEPNYINTIGSAERDESKALKRAKELLDDWKRTWYGYDEFDPLYEDTVHVPGAKEFLENNNLDLLLSQLEQDDVMLDIYFPTVGLQRGRRGAWKPKVVKVGMLPAHSCRLGVMNKYRHIDYVFYSDSLRTKGATGVTTTASADHSFTRYHAAMPQNLLSDMRYIVSSNQRTRIKERPTWIVCPTFYPSLNKPYYPQPAWWSVFTSKAFDFSATILYDKYKHRENSTSWGKIIYISLDYLDMVYGQMGIAGDIEKQDAFINELDQNVEQFLQMRENNGKMMRQFKWTGQDGKDHYNVEIVDVTNTTKDAAAAGKEELELSTSPIFLALRVDPRLVGVPMVAASNGGTALREMQLLKQQQLNVKQRLFLNWANTAIATFNEWSERGFFGIMQQTLTTLDASKTGTKDILAGEGA